MVTKIRIMVDASPLIGPMSGIGRYTQRLIHALQELLGPEQVTAFLDSLRVDPRNVLAAAGLAPTNARHFLLPRRLLLHLWRYGIASPLLLDRDAELIHSTNYRVFPKTKRPQIVGVHDTTIWTNPEWHFAGRTRELTEQLGQLRHIDGIIVHTEHVAKQVAELAGMPRVQVHVVPHGVDPALGGTLKLIEPETSPAVSRALSDRYGLEPGYVLYLGTIEPRKNLPLLFEAYRGLPPATRLRHPLVIAGAPGWKTGPIYAAAADLQAEGSVRFLGRVAEDDLTAVLRSAALFVYPSLEEGFGLPPLEAMAHGVATLISDAPALVEVSGAGAVVLSREDPSGWTSTIKALLADDEARQLLAHRGHVHASRYTWRRTAELTIDVYRQVIARGSR